MSAFITKSMELDHTRSASDKKHYRLLTLSNGLKVLLVSTKDLLPREEQHDITKMKSAAAIAVQVGSYSDPEYAGKFKLIVIFIADMWLTNCCCYVSHHRGMCALLGAYGVYG